LVFKTMTLVNYTCARHSFVMYEAIKSTNFIFRTLYSALTVKKIGSRNNVVIVIIMIMLTFIMRPITTKQEHRCSTKIQIVVDETY